MERRRGDPVGARIASDGVRCLERHHGGSSIRCRGAEGRRRDSAQLCKRLLLTELPWDTRDGGFAGLGSFGDSYYEYLLKYWLLTGKRDSAYREMWDRAARHILDTTDRTAPLVVPNGRETGNTMEHLACFSGGLFALSYLTDGNKEHLELAKQIAETCHAMYQSSVTKLSPDVAQIHGTQVHSTESKFILRPETVETYFYLWRATHDTKYRQWGLEMLRACDRYLKVEDGFVGTRDVFSEHGSKNDMLETFWFAETLKYLYLLFREDAALSLTQKVFNTEAHPFLVHPAP